jgi:general secretion pathway protein G
VSLKSLKKQEGFTLLELLIVIVIIAILALLIIPNITSAPKKARDTQRKTDITTVRKALEEYFVNNNSYPSTGGDAATVLSGAADGQGTSGPLTTGTAPLMKKVPLDPKKASPSQYYYNYQPSGTPATSYTLGACLENDQDNGASVGAGNQTGAPTGCGATDKSFVLTNAN